jgi:predicted DNA-binding transcriptional regulator YafY
MASRSEVSTLLTPMAVRFVKIERALRRERVVPMSRLLRITGVSLPTLKRDLACMRDELGAPIQFHQPEGGYRFCGPWPGVASFLFEHMEAA